MITLPIAWHVTIAITIFTITYEHMYIFILHMNICTYTYYICTYVHIHITYVHIFLLIKKLQLTFGTTLNQSE